MRKTLKLNDISLSQAVFAVGTILAALQVLGAVAFLYNARQAEIRAQQAELHERTNLLAAHTRQIFGAARLVLESVAEDARRVNAQSPEEFRAAMATRETFDRLVARASVVPQVDVATIVATNGDVVNFTRSYPPPPINLADRDYFKAHFTGEGLALHVSTPVHNRGTGTWTFYLSQAIRSSHGEIIGLVLTGIKANFFVDAFRMLHAGDDTALSLFRSDGVLLSRAPWREDAVGKSFRDQAAFQILHQTPQGRAALTGSLRIADPGTSYERIVSPAPVPDFPVVVNITQSLAPLLAGWRSNMRLVAATVGPAALLTLLLTWLAAYLLRQRDGLIVDLMAAKDAAEIASRAKSEFLANMSHEVRTPLNGILGTIELLKEKAFDSDTTKLMDNADVSARHLLVVVNDILDLSKLEAGALEMDIGPCSIRKIVQQVVSLHGPQAAANRDRLTWSIAKDVPECLSTDERRLRQVILNLVSNAIKFTKDGEVRIEAAGRPTADGRFQLEISVTDTGIGIPESARAKLFEAFSQADGSISRRYGGTGLGLSICRRLVHLLGGTIGVTSREGEGSKFHFALPCEIGTAPEIEAPQAAASTAIEPLRILVAEDNAINQQIIGHMLKARNHRCTFVGNGREAIEAVQAGTYDVVLMDVQMPEMGGIEATRAIRRLPAPHAAIPVIMLTANAMAGDRERYLAAGANDYVSKPINKALLMAAIARFGTPAAGPAAAVPEDDAHEASAEAEMSAEGTAALEKLIADLGGSAPR